MPAPGSNRLSAFWPLQRFFTYACKLRGYKRLLLFASAVPIAVMANVVRIAVLTMVAGHWDVALSTPGGWVHDLMGFVVFVIAFSLMFVLEELLDLLPGAPLRRVAGREPGKRRQARNLLNNEVEASALKGEA